MDTNKRRLAFISGSMMVLLLGSASPASAYTVQVPPSIESPESVQERSQGSEGNLTPEIVTPETTQPEVKAAEADVSTEKRTVSGTLTLPKGSPAKVMEDLELILSPVAGQNKSCSSESERIFDRSTGQWEFVGLDACVYEFSGWVLIDGVNSWTSQALRLVRIGAPDQNESARRVDLREGSVVGVDFTSQSLGNTGISEVTVTTKDKLSTSEAPSSLVVIDAVTGKQASPRVTVFDGLVSTSTLPRGYTSYTYVALEMELPSGTYKLAFLERSSKLKIWYNGTKTGTLDESKAKVFTITPLSGQVLPSPSYAEGGSRFDFREAANAGIPFTDVTKTHKFYRDIQWLADSKMTTGVKQKDGTLKFLPKDNVSREAMVTFLYRSLGAGGYKPKGKSPFTDVKPGDKFYTQIMWAYETKVTTGFKQQNGTRRFEPKAAITREAMAAFMYRSYAEYYPDGETIVKFTDVPASHKFAKEIKWMASNKVTTGTKQVDGTVRFNPKAPTTREATAAFLHRASGDSRL